MNKKKDFAPVKRGKGHFFCKSHGKLESMIMIHYAANITLYKLRCDKHFPKEYKKKLHNRPDQPMK